MNHELLHYKTRFLTCLLLISYAYLHVQLTGVYIDVSLDQLMDLSARLPFGQRILVPILAHGLASILPLDTSNIFFILELFFVSLLYIATKQLLQYEFSVITATYLSWLFFLLLPLVTVINYGFTTSHDAPFYYPYDTSSLFFMTAGFLLCLRGQWFLFTILIIFATLNRESSILLVLLIPMLHWSRLKDVFKPFIFTLTIYLLTRSIIILLGRKLTGVVAEFYYTNTSSTHFEVNLYWLLNSNHLFLFFYCMAGLPVFWFTFYNYIPSRYRPIRYLALGYFLGLLLVGNFSESRIYGEIVILLYLPVCVAISYWLSQKTPPIEKTRGILFYLNHYAVLGILMIVVGLRNVILSII